MPAKTPAQKIAPPHPSDIDQALAGEIGCEIAAAGKEREPCLNVGKGNGRRDENEEEEAIEVGAMRWR